MSLNEFRAVDEALAAFAGDVAHEIAGVISFFEGFAKAYEKIIDEEDRSIAEEEIQRLNTLLARLRRMKFPEPNLAETAIDAIVTRACEDTAALFREQGITLDAQENNPTTGSVDAEMALRLIKQILFIAATMSKPGSQAKLSSKRDSLRITFLARQIGADSDPGDRSWKRGLDIDKARLIVIHRTARCLGWQVTFGGSAEQCVVNIAMS